MKAFGRLSVALDTALLRKSQRSSQEGRISSEIRSPHGDQTPPPTHPFPAIVDTAHARVFGVGSSLGLVAQLVRARA